MSRKLSTRKRPDRDKHMIKEQLKIEEGVFDNRTMMNISRAFTHNIVSKFDFIIARGKEADVYLADAGSRIEDDVVVVKIFRIETSSFFKRIDYIVGDPRFEKIKTNQYNIVNTWCKKEFGNLKIAELAGIHAPKPYFFSGNVLAIEFIGDDGAPAQTLKKVGTKSPEKTLDMIIEDLKKLYGKDLVHGDVSEYNIVMKNNIPYLIDFGQAVVLRHPNAVEFLQRDVRNILAYFKKEYGVTRDSATIMEYITKA